MATPSSSPRHRGLRFVTGFVILAAGIGGFIALAALRQPPPSRPPAVQPPLVRTVTVERNSGPVTVKGNGIVRPRAEIGLAPRVSGKVEWLHPDFVSGGTIRRGDVLFRLDRRSYQHELDRIRAEQRATRARIDYTEKQIERTGKLVAKGTATEDEYDRLLSEKEELQANLEGLAARLEQARLDLDFTSVTAPFDGRIRSEEVDIGEYLTPGEVVARLFPMDEYEIVVPLTDREARLVPRLWRGDSGERVPAVVSTRYGGRRYYWDAYVHRTEAAIDEQTRTVNVIVRVPEPARPGSRGAEAKDHAALIESPPPLVVGMYTTISIQGISVDRYFTLPRSAIRENDTIWSLTADDTIAVHDVEVIQETDGDARIIAPGLADGARVIINNLPVMSDGMKVRTMEDSGRSASGVRTGS